MRYSKPILHFLQFDKYIESACLDGDRASSPKSCNQGINADSTCTVGISATHRCTNGTAPGNICENGISV